MKQNDYNLLKYCSDKKDMTEWNLYRLRNPKKSINLKLKSLDNFYLLEANLNNINLSFTSLSKAKLNGADVSNSKIISKKFLFTSIFILVSILAYIIDYFGINFIKLSNNIEGAYTLSIIISTIFIDIFIDNFSRNKLKMTLFTLIVQAIGIVSILLLILFYSISWISTDVIAWRIIYFIFIFITYIILKDYYKEQQEAIALTNNPEDVINFNNDYLLEEKKSTLLKEELTNIERQLKEKEKIKEELENDVNLSSTIRVNFENRLNDIQKKETESKEYANLLRDKILIIEKQENDSEQVKQSMDAIKESFSYLNKTEKSIFFMNIIYGLFLIIGISMLAYFGYLSYLHREDYFSKLTDITFSSSLGIVIFYATPILFSFSIIIFSISNLNKNIKEKEKIFEKKYLIELLESTFYAQIRLGNNTKNALQKLIDKLADSAYDKLSSNNSENNKDNIKENKISFKNKKQLEMIIQSLFKKI